MPFCYECGVKVAPDDPFCGNCGTAQKSLSANSPLPSIISHNQLAETDPTVPAPPREDTQHAPESSTQLADPEETIMSRPTTDPQKPLSSVLAYEAPDAPAQEEVRTGLSDTLVGTVEGLIPSEDAPEAATTGEVETPSAEPPPVVETVETQAQPETASSEALAATDTDEHAPFNAEDTLEPVAATASPSSSSAEEPPVTPEQAEPESADIALGDTDETPVSEIPMIEEKEEPSAAPLNDTLAPEAVSRSTGELSSNAHAMETTVPAGTTAGSSRRPGSKQLEPGTLLNVRYEIVRRIGGGGMGAVYLAKDRHLGDAPRAVKEMIETHLDESQHEKAIGDFKRESLLLTSLEHPSIPTIYDYFYDDQAGRFYLVMKYISGGDFASRLRNAPGNRIDEKTTTVWGMEVADVLDYLHNRRPRPIIYRDLKPANLMIDGNSGRVMLIDFGIARWVNKTEEKGVTAVGTMGYAPPELFSGKVEPRSDIYSLGATLFHLLTGSDPQDNPLLIFDFTKNPRPRSINPSISVEMERILMRAVEYKPEGRFRSAAEMREALAAHLERLRVGDVSYGTVTAAQGAGETLQVEMVFCGFCGGRIAADDLFCAHCGAKQPLAGISPSAALQAARSTAKLVVAGTTELDASFLLQKDSNLVGRSDPHSNIFPEVDLSRFDPETKVSRRHARIWRKGETFLVEDLGSVNGTVLLGRDNDTVRLAPHQPRVLENGDKLRLGETMLHFLVG